MGFKALILEERDGKVVSAIREITEADLPDGDVLVAVSHSTLNYKDGLILNGLGRLVRQYPHVPGVDLSGTVEQSSDRAWSVGDKVILTGWRVGETRWGGYAAKARVKGDWLVRLPDGMTPARAMAIGTAGLTAMLAIMALERNGLERYRGDAGEILVTGAGGGLGSIATAILAKRGYGVTASTGRASTHGMLRELGAARIIERAEIGSLPEKPLGSERWAGAIDSVGGATLANLLSAMKYRSSVAACGLAGGAELKTTVIPFIIRGVNLLGIDSVMAPKRERETAWQRLASELPPEKLDRLTRHVRLEELQPLGSAILKGEVEGRIVIDL